MKRIFNILAIALAGVFTIAVTACNRDDGDITDADGNISVFPGSLTFPAGGNTQTVAITSAFDWDFAASASWIAATRSNNSLLITVGSTTEAREGEITVTNTDGRMATVTVGQEAAPAVADITASPVSLTFPVEGDTKLVAITSNTDWDFTASASWIVASRSGISLSVAVAGTTEARDGSITVTNTDGKTAIITISQEAPPVISEIVISPASLTFPVEGNTQSVTITSDADWDFTASASWIVAEKSGNSLSVTVAGTTEAREGNIAITNTDGKTATITIVQEPPVEITIDDLVGTWSVSEIFISNLRTMGQQWEAFNNPHTLVMTKMNDTRLVITGFAGPQAGIMDNEYKGRQVAYADYDPSTKTITLIARAFLPAWEEGSVTYFSGMNSDVFSENTNIDIPAVVSESLSFSPQSFELKDPAGVGPSEWIAYHISVAMNNYYLGTYWYTISSEWEKISDSTTFAAAPASAPALVNFEAMKIGMNDRVLNSVRYLNALTR